MKACNVCRVEKSANEFHRRAKSADGLAYSCKPCDNARRKAGYLARHEQELTYRAEWRAANPERARQYVRDWVRRHPEQKAAIDAARPYDSAKEKSRRERRQGSLNAYFKAYKLARKNRIPPWADLNAIKAVYERAQHIQALTGEPVHVDHDIPLHGKLVSGLHVHTNLVIRLAAENLRKSNRFEVA